MGTKKQQLNKTRAAAKAFIEDYEHMDSIVSQDPQKAADLRRSAVIVRRWLVENELKHIASPRIGRIQLEAPDNEPFYRSAKKQPLLMFMSLGMPVHGVMMTAMVADKGNPNRLDTRGYDPSARIKFTIESFLKQDVICFQGDWINRRDIIRYVSNVARGVHGLEPKTDADKRLARWRHSISVSLVDPKEDPNHPPEMPDDIGLIPSVNINVNAKSEIDLPIKYDQSCIDCALLELLAIMYFLVVSTDMRKLHEAIQKEIYQIKATNGEGGG